MQAFLIVRYGFLNELWAELQGPELLGAKGTGLTELPSLLRAGMRYRLLMFFLSQLWSHELQPLPWSEQ